MTPFIRLIMRLFIIAIFTSLILFFTFRFFTPETKQETTINHHVVVQEIVALGKLELVKFQFKDVVEYQKDQTSYSTLNRFLPKAKAVLIISGEAVGCVDLTKIAAEDVKQGQDSIFVVLPAPEVCYNKINHDKSKVYDVSNGYFVEEGQMVGEAFKSAENQIKTTALESDILNQTKVNALKILQPTLERISGKRVVLRWKEMAK